MSRLMSQSTRSSFFSISGSTLIGSTKAEFGDAIDWTVEELRAEEADDEATCGAELVSVKNV